MREANGPVVAARVGEIPPVAGAASRVCEPERLIVHAVRTSTATRTAARTATAPIDLIGRLAVRSVGIFAEHRSAKHIQAHTADVQGAAMKRLEVEVVASLGPRVVP